MNDEIMTEEIKTEGIDFTPVMTDTYDDCGTSGSNGNLVKLILKGLGVAAVAGALLYSQKDKIKEWNDKRLVKKMEKKGFIVCTPEELDAMTVDNHEEDQESEESTEQ